MADSVFTHAERQLLNELETRGVRYLVVGMSAALVQGARGATEGIDLWFESLSDPRLGEAPRIGGDELGERFDVVTHMDGLEGFAQEYAGVRFELIDGVRLPLLPLRRILHSKKTAGRPKDLLAAHAIEDALKVLEASDEPSA